MDTTKQLSGKMESRIFGEVQTMQEMLEQLNTKIDAIEQKIDYLRDRKNKQPFYNACPCP